MINIIYGYVNDEEKFRKDDYIEKVINEHDTYQNVVFCDGKYYMDYYKAIINPLIKFQFGFFAYNGIKMYNIKG
ncbi:hypothetical protein SH2C18_41390 [Clostridium sediminicola]